VWSPGTAGLHTYTCTVSRTSSGSGLHSLPAAACPTPTLMDSGRAARPNLQGPCGSSAPLGLHAAHPATIHSIHDRRVLSARGASLTCARVASKRQGHAITIHAIRMPPAIPLWSYREHRRNPSDGLEGCAWAYVTGTTASGCLSGCASWKNGRPCKWASIAMIAGKSSSLTSKRRAA